jgi:pyruvate dehydrogenase E1 component alpha subunit
MKEIAGQFEVDFVQLLDNDGNIMDGSVRMPPLSDQVLLEKYELLKFLRAFDNKALSLQRQGRMGTYSEFKGQEAVQVGAMMALDERDWFFPTYRDSAAMISRGVKPEKILQYWAGDEWGQHFSDDINVFPIAIPVASQVPHAVGAAFALKYKKSNAISLVTIGDGGTSKADFYEGLNMAGDLRLPVVCIIENNQYAISLPRKEQSAAKTLAQKALAFGVQGIQVDGNDLLAVYSTISNKVAEAREGRGPSIVECVTYRLGHHTTATGDEPYRLKKEIEKWVHRDPIERLRRFLEKKGLWTEQKESEIDARVKERIDGSVRKFESLPRPDPKDTFEYTYHEMPKKLRREMESLEDSASSSRSRSEHQVSAAQTADIQNPQ